MRGKAPGIGPLDHKDDRGPLPSAHRSLQLPQVPCTPGGGSIGEPGHAVLDQRHRLDLHPACARRSLQPKIQPAFAQPHLPVNAVIAPKRFELARRQGLGKEGVGQPRVDRDEHASDIHQREVEACLAVGTFEPGQPADSTGGQQLSQPSRVGQVGSSGLALDFDSNPKAVVAPHKAARDQRWQSHVADYTTGTGDGKRPTGRGAEQIHRFALTRIK